VPVSVAVVPLSGSLFSELRLKLSFNSVVECRVIALLHIP